MTAQRAAKHAQGHWQVDESGIRLPGPVEGALDVCFGPDRVWSFSTVGAEQQRNGGVLVPWPDQLRRFLDGVTLVSVHRHPRAELLYSETISFGSGTGPLRMCDETGQPLSIDKNGRIQRSFESYEEGSRRELLQAARSVADALTRLCGLDVYLSYGCLLGAVRTGRMIGHDADVDLAYLSRHDHPFDVIREARAAERCIRGLGWKVIRLSAANFKVWVPLAGGGRAGIDVFGSFYVDDVFHLTGNLRGPLPRDAVLPIGTVSLEGVDLPAPADPDAFLSFTYGPDWRIPDPAFHFGHAEQTKTRMNQLLRAGRAGMRHWEPFYARGTADRVPTGPSEFAAWVAHRIEPGARIFEVGSGTARDAIWLAQQGFDPIASEYVGTAWRYARQQIKQAGVSVPVRQLNLTSQRSLLVRGAKLAQRSGPTQVYARFVIDALAEESRPGLWRFARMAGRGGGHTFVEFRTDRSPCEPTYFGPHQRTYASPERITHEIASFGGRVVTREEGYDLARLERENPHVCRLEVSWT